MSINPWEVHCIKDFLFLNCPECSFKTKGKDFFQDHAVKNHPLSDAFYENDPFKRDDFQNHASIASQIESVEDIVCKDDETLGVKKSSMVTRKRITRSSDSGPSKRLKTIQSNTKSKPVVIKFSSHKPKNSSLGTTECAVPSNTKKTPIKVSKNEKVLLEHVSESMESEENDIRIVEDEPHSNTSSSNTFSFFDTFIGVFFVFEGTAHSVVPKEEFLGL
jgi:hypothetical protein